MLTARKSATSAMFASFLVVAMQAQSQEPAPSPRETGKPEQTSPRDTENRAGGDQKNTKPLPVIVNVLAPPKTEAEATEERREREEKAQLDRRLVDLTKDMAIFTGGLFAATIALFLATGALWWYTRRLVKGAEDTAKRQLRAYVHVADAIIQHANSEWPEIKIQFKNYGQTPAYRVTNRFKCGLQLIGEPDFTLPEKITIYSDLGPTQDSVTILVIAQIDWEFMMANVMHNSGTALVSGEITYSDVFQHVSSGRPHHTWYRFHIQANAKGAPDVLFTDEGNSSD
jgi:hypothetical protein